MNEAIRQGMASTNPSARLGLKKGPTKEKPEITDDEIAAIRSALATRPEWMRTCFEIAIHQGCRFAETCLPLSNVDLERNRITFHAKGGKTFTTLLHDALIPLFTRLRKEGHTRSFDMPAQTGREWTRFFRKIGLRHLCFHSTRVTVVTRLCRAGVTESQAMRFVGHASETIHRIYQRLRAEDVSACVSALRIPSNASADLAPAIPARAPASSLSHTRTDTPPTASPSHTKATSSKRRPVPSQ
ncbi:MAG: tyrosine-type recombinase/integrase [Chthoniobacter sp.]